MNTRTPFLLALALGLAGCGKAPEQPPPPAAAPKTPEASPASEPAEAAETAEAAARRFCEAINNAEKGSFEDILFLVENGRLSNGLKKMIKEEVEMKEKRNAGENAIVERREISFERPVPEPDRAVFDVSLFDGDRLTVTDLMELKKTGSRWIVSNLGDGTETQPYHGYWAIRTPEMTVRSFFEAYKWIPRGREGAAVVYCAKQATDAWLESCQWRIGKLEPKTEEDAKESFEWPENWAWEWHSKEARPRWRFDPEISPKETSIPWDVVRIDKVELPKHETRSPELSSFEEFRPPFEELEGMTALVTASFLDVHGETLFKRTFVVKPLNPNPPFWVICGER